MSKEKIYEIPPPEGAFRKVITGVGYTFKIGVLIALIVLMFWLNPFIVISAGHRGVVLNFGAASDTVLSEGLHFRTPIVQKIVQIDVRIQKSETKVNASSKDLQMVTSVIALNYHLDPANVNLLFKNVGLNYEGNIIDPAVQEGVKAITAKYTAEELITQREKVSDSIKSSLELRLQKYFIRISDFSIKDFEFSQTFSKTVEEKQVAEQLALKASRDLDRIKIEAEQQITRAKAEAETLRLKNQMVTPLMIQLHAIEKWDGKLPEYMGAGPLPFLNLR